MDAHNLHFSKLEYILNYCFQSPKVGENGGFLQLHEAIFDSTFNFFKKIFSLFKGYHCNLWYFLFK